MILKVTALLGKAISAKTQLAYALAPQRIAQIVAHSQAVFFGNDFVATQIKEQGIIVFVMQYASVLLATYKTCENRQELSATYG